MWGGWTVLSFGSQRAKAPCFRTPEGVLFTLWVRWEANSQAQVSINEWHVLVFCAQSADKWEPSPQMNLSFLSDGEAAETG